MKLLICALSLILVGCTGLSSIKIGGSYGEGKDKVGGEITLVVNEQKSTEEGVAVLDGSDGKSYTPVELGDLSKIGDVVKDLLGEVGIKSEAQWTAKNILEKIQALKEKFTKEVEIKK